MSRIKDRIELGPLGNRATITVYRREHHQTALSQVGIRRNHWTVEEEGSGTVTGYMYDREGQAERHAKDWNRKYARHYKFKTRLLQPKEFYTTFDHGRTYQHHVDDGLGGATEDRQKEYEAEEQESRRSKNPTRQEMHERERQEKEEESGRWRPWEVPGWYDH